MAGFRTQQTEVTHWQRYYQEGQVPAPPLGDQDREWVTRILESHCRVEDDHT